MSDVVDEEEWPWCWPRDSGRYRKIDVVPWQGLETPGVVREHGDENYPGWDIRGNEICPSMYVLYLESPDGKDAVALLSKELR